MASQEVLDDFIGGFTTLSGEVPGTLTGVSFADWSTITQSGAGTSAFQKTSSGTTCVMPAAGQARYARLNLSTLTHSAGVTTFEASMAPGGQMRINLDFLTRYLVLEVHQDGTGNWIWDNTGSFNNGSFSTTVPGAAVVLRIELTSTATRYYVDNVLVNTFASGIAYATDVINVRLGYPGAFAVHGYSTGTTVLALNRLQIKTETVTGPLGGVSQPAPTDSADIKVLFSDAFSTTINLDGSHGEEGPLASAVWQCTEYREGLAPVPETPDHWTRGEVDGLTAKKFERVPIEVGLNAACFAGSNAARFTNLPIVLETLVPLGYIEFTALFSVAAGPAAPFAQASFSVTADGGVLLSWISGGTSEALRKLFSFVFAPTTIGGGGLPIRMELWANHLRLYANGALIGTMKEVDTSHFILTSEQVELTSWALAIDSPDAFSTTPAPVVKRFTLSGVQDSSGELPVEADPDAPPPAPLGPGNEPDPADPYANFWTKFNATYEVP